MSKKRLVVLTKEPLSYERIEAVKRIKAIPSIEIVGVIIEDAIHLPLYKFAARTLKRIYHGHIYFPEFVANVFSHFLKPKQSDESFNPEQALRKMGVSTKRVKNVQADSAIAYIKTLNPDLGIILGHRILPKKVFSLPKEGTLNVHHGILPRYAGSHTTFWRIVDGYKDIGVTIHKVADKVDGGDILHIKAVLLKNDTYTSAYEKVKGIVPLAVFEALEGLVKGDLRYKKQTISEQKYWKPPTFWQRIKYRKLLR